LLKEIGKKWGLKKISISPKSLSIFGFLNSWVKKSKQRLGNLNSFNSTFLRLSQE